MNTSLVTLTGKLEELGLSFMASSLESFLAEQSRNENTLLERLADLVDLEYIPRRERAARCVSSRIFVHNYRDISPFLSRP